MADYHPLVARAVAGLDKSTGENRRALYERARAALVAQLRSVEPALDESDITRERLALEDAIRKVEAEAVKRQRVEPGEAPAPPPTLSDQGLRGFRETMADAESLGGAAAEANRSARQVYETMPGVPPPPTGARSPEHHIEPSPAAEPLQAHEQPRAGEDARPRVRPPPPHDLDAGEIYARPRRSYGGIVKFIVLLLILGGIAGAGYWQRNTILQMVADFRSAPATKPRPATEPAGRPKIADRIGSGGGEPANANAPAAAVAQKVVLYDEDPNDPKGKRYVGSALWRTETVSPGPGLAPELAIRADIEIPERHMRMTWSLRRNTDKALPASHTIEIMFTLPADFSEGGVANVPGVLMKQDEQARGVPLAGLAVKVTNGYFLIGLSAVDVDVQRNVQMLKERDWFDIPIVYTSGKRAILAMEKGTPGVRAFEEAFRAWGE